uniref:Suppressor of forked domain-containing protein n=1 Tax=Tetranychus urticae TaxID=32264 RepID=T1JXI3_TETUR
MSINILDRFNSLSSSFLFFFFLIIFKVTTSTNNKPLLLPFLKSIYFFIDSHFSSSTLSSLSSSSSCFPSNQFLIVLHLFRIKNLKVYIHVNNFDSSLAVTFSTCRELWYFGQSAFSYGRQKFSIDPDFGDAWGYFYKFELMHGTEAQQQEVKNKCVDTEPRHNFIIYRFPHKTFKLESELSEYSGARKLLTKARASAPSARVFMKLAKLEWALGQNRDRLKLLNEGVKDYPTYPKLWMMIGQIDQSESKFNPTSIPFLAVTFST